MRVRREVVWATLFGAGVAYEVHELRAHSGGTLSEVVRWLVKAETPTGKVVFMVGWGAFASWFGHHIVTPPAPPGIER